MKTGMKKGILKAAFAAALVMGGAMAPVHNAMAYGSMSMEDEDTTMEDQMNMINNVIILGAVINAAEQDAAVQQAIQKAVQEVKVNGNINLTQIEKINKAVQSPKLTKAMNTLVDNGTITQQQVPFFIPAVIKLGYQNLHGKQMTDSQQQKLLDTVGEMQTTAEVEAKTPQQAVNIGMDGDLAPYFNACKVKTDTTGTQVTYAQAQVAEACMSNQHFEKDIKPNLIIAGEIGAVGLGLMGVALAALTRKKKYSM